MNKMQGGKEINNVSATTAIDLKAQLAQHVEQFEKVRSSTGKQAKAAVAAATKKQTVWSRQNKGVQARNERDAKQHLDQVEGSTLARSREQLERKARLYEAMKEGRVQQQEYENEEQSPLIDFDRKYMLEKELKDNTLQKDRKRKRKKDEDEDDDDPWVEYEDEFGRTRIVRRSELPSHNDASDHSCYSDEDEEYEQRRRRPGHDGFGSREDMNHYEADREIRTKGVGFYSFSKDEHERQEQMAKLKALRDETVDARQSATLSASEKRKQLLAKNAEKIRARKAALQAKKHHQLKPELVPTTTTTTTTHSPPPSHVVNEDSVSEFLKSIRKQVEK